MPLGVETYNLWDYVLLAHVLNDSCNLAFEACGEGYVQIYLSWSFDTKAVKVDNQYLLCNLVIHIDINHRQSKVLNSLSLFENIASQSQ